jgi:hypothetical protein
MHVWTSFANLDWARRRQTIGDSVCSVGWTTPHPLDADAAQAMSLRWEATHLLSDLLTDAGLRTAPTRRRSMRDRDGRQRVQVARGAVDGGVWRTTGDRGSSNWLGREFALARCNWATSILAWQHERRLEPSSILQFNRRADSRIEDLSTFPYRTEITLAIDPIDSLPATRLSRTNRCA